MGQNLHHTLAFYRYTDICGTVSLLNTPILMCHSHTVCDVLTTQNATPLVRLKTLALLDVILKRASETASALKTNESGAVYTLLYPLLQ